MISIIVPVYKVEPYLAKCIESILNQTFKDLEIILIDDGSPDRCGKICEEYARKDGRIKTYHTENKGLSAARNLGLRAAKGEYIGFVDSDDWIEPDMYELLFDRMKEKSADACVCGFWEEGVELSKEIHFLDTVYNTEEALISLIDGQIRSYVWNKLFRKCVFENVFFPEGKYYEDIETMCIVMSRCNAISVISPAKYHYRERDNSISKTYDAQKIVDYANSWIDRYTFLKNEQHEVFITKKESLIKSIVSGNLRLWSWWYGFSTDEKREYYDQIRALMKFAQDNIPILGYRSWPSYLRLSSVFIRTESNLIFKILYILNQVRKIN